MSWKSDKGKTSFQAVLGWFSPILVLLECLGRLQGICKWLVYRNVLKSRKAKMAKKTYLFFRHFHDTKVHLSLIPTRATDLKFSIYICFLINYIGFLYEMALLVD